jgi:hypothetical protein
VPPAGKGQRKIITDVGRKLLGFVWTIGVRAEAAAKQQMAAWRTATLNSRTEPATAGASTKENPRML